MLDKHGLVDYGSGVTLGSRSDADGDHVVRDDGPDHMMISAPTRSGKSTSVIIPTLLSWPHSVLDLDIKGEHFALTSGCRSTEFNNRILKFDPMNLESTGCRYNPLDQVRLRTLFEVSDVRDIVNSLLSVNASSNIYSSDPTESAVSNFLIGAIIHTLYFEADKSLAGALYFITNRNFESPEQMYQFILNAAHDADLSQRWVDDHGVVTATHPAASKAALDMLNLGITEASRILAVAIRALEIFGDPNISRNTATTDFEILDLLQGDRPLSLYLVVYPTYLERLKPLLNIFMNQMLRVLTSVESDPSLGATRQPLLLMLEDFSVLGRLDISPHTLNTMIRLGIKACFIADNIESISSIYGGLTQFDDIFLKNCRVQVSFDTQTKNQERLPRNVLTYDGKDTSYFNKIRYYEDPIFFALSQLPLFVAR